MKKIKLDSAKLQLKKAKISSLTKKEMIKVQGGMRETMDNWTRPTCIGATCQYA